MVYQAKIMFTQVYSKTKDLDAFLIIGGDFNDAPNDLMDRIPERISQNAQFKATVYLSEKMSAADAWRFFFNTACKESIVGVMRGERSNLG